MQYRQLLNQLNYASSRYQEQARMAMDTAAVPPCGTGNMCCDLFVHSLCECMGGDVFMHVKAKTMAFTGLLLALTVIFMVLGSVIGAHYFFGIFFVGIIIREFGLRIGAAFYAAGGDTWVYYSAE